MKLVLRETICDSHLMPFLVVVIGKRYLQIAITQQGIEVRKCYGIKFKKTNPYQEQQNELEKNTMLKTLEKEARAP